MEEVDLQERLRIEAALLRELKDSTTTGQRWRWLRIALRFIRRS